MQREYWPTIEWQHAKPEAVGMDPEKINELGNMINNKYSNLNGIVVVRKGYVIYERYYNGCGPLDVHNVASITKSVISALVGIAIDAGFIKSIDQKVLEFFPEYSPDAEDILKRTITLRHLLTMTAPFPFSGRKETNAVRRRLTDCADSVIGSCIYLIFWDKTVNPENSSTTLVEYICCRQ